jgi:hypothetical protein
VSGKPKKRIDGTASCNSIDPDYGATFTLKLSHILGTDKKGELLDSSPFQTVLDSRYNCPIARNLMIALVAGGFENRPLVYI